MKSFFFLHNFCISFFFQIPSYFTGTTEDWSFWKSWTSSVVVGSSQRSSIQRTPWDSCPRAWGSDSVGWAYRPSVLWRPFRPWSWIWTTGGHIGDSKRSAARMGSRTTLRRRGHSRSRRKPRKVWSNSSNPNLDWRLRTSPASHCFQRRNWTGTRTAFGGNVRPRRIANHPWWSDDPQTTTHLRRSKDGHNPWPAAMECLWHWP